MGIPRLVLLLARLNNVLLVVLVVMAFVLRTHRVLRNEYEIPDGQMLLLYGYPLAVVPLSLVLCGVALWKRWGAPEDPTLRTASWVSALPLVPALLWACVIWVIPTLSR